MLFILSIINLVIPLQPRRLFISFPQGKETEAKKSCRLRSKATPLGRGLNETNSLTLKQRFVLDALSVAPLHASALRTESVTAPLWFGRPFLTCTGRPVPMRNGVPVLTCSCLRERMCSLYHERTCSWVHEQ